MGQYADLDQGIAGRTFAKSRPALAGQAQDLPVFEPGRNGHVQGAAIRQGEPPHGAERGGQEIDAERITRVRALGVEIGAGAPAEGLGEDPVQVLGIEGLLGPVLGPARVVAEVAIELTCGRLLLARGVDLAPIEAGALLRIGQQGIGRGDRLETLFGFLLARIEVGVMQLGELAIARPDLRLRRGSRYAQQFIGIIHGGQDSKATGARKEPRELWSTRRRWALRASPGRAWPRTSRAIWPRSVPACRCRVCVRQDGRPA